MGKPSIEILDPVHCKANKEARELILPCLAYTDIVYRRQRFGSKSVKTKSHLITGRKGTGGTFLAGLLSRVENFAAKNKFKLEIMGNGNIDEIPYQCKPKLRKIELRSDQKKTLRRIKKVYRGNIIATTGSGKTVIANGIFSMFPNSPILFLCHTKDILNQTYESIKEFLPGRKVFRYSGTHKVDFEEIKAKRKDGPIIIATIQTFAKLDPSVYIDFFDITIVDEVHHVNSKKSQYGKVMECNLSPRRYGMTATKPNKSKEILVNEGFFGPLVTELDMDEAIEKGINAKPVVKLIPIKFDSELAEQCGKSYRKYYQFGIVENKERNKRIFKTTRRSIRKKQVCLIIIERTEHGKILQKLFAKNGYDVPFIHGATKRDERERVKKLLKREKIYCAICSRVWREGTNIPSLRKIVNGHGMKEEKIILQAMGRGLRTFKDKEKIILVDFLDPYKFLAEHAILRVQIYIKQGWL